MFKALFSFAPGQFKIATIGPSRAEGSVTGSEAQGVVCKLAYGGMEVIPDLITALLLDFAFLWTAYHSLSCLPLLPRLILLLSLLLMKGPTRGKMSQRE